MSTETAPSWELLETFLCVLRSGSLSAASRELAVAQPTVRRRVEALESVLGTVLFTRATNGLVPTAAAELTRPAAEAMEAAARAVVRSASGALDDAKGTVRVTASKVMGSEVLPALLAPLLAANPGLQVELVTSNRLADLLRRDADVAVRMAAPTQAALVARRAGVIPVGFFAHRSYLRRHGEPTKLAELAGHALVGADHERGLIAALGAMGVELAPRDFVFRTDDDVAQLAAIRAGIGIGACQVPLGERTRELVRVLPRQSVPLEAWLVMHEDLRRVRRVKMVFEHLVGALAQYVAEA
jgi:DNA-binding transcriptional LysR family regulator